MTIEDKNLPGAWDAMGDATVVDGLVFDIALWGIQRNITSAGGATALSQTKKMFEEVQEFIDANTEEEALDALGDIGVVWLQMLRLRGVTVEDALWHAYEQIKDRKGRMENGVFVKEA